MKGTWENDGEEREWVVGHRLAGFIPWPVSISAIHLGEPGEYLNISRRMQARSSPSFSPVLKSN